jgi:cytochrome c oxidase cbb3-type subunit 4
MSIDDLRIAVTLLSLACFAGLLLWTWSARNRRGFDEAAGLPFAPDGSDREDAAGTHRSEGP